MRCLNTWPISLMYKQWRWVLANVNACKNMWSLYHFSEDKNNLQTEVHLYLEILTYVPLICTVNLSGLIAPLPDGKNSVVYKGFV